MYTMIKYVLLFTIVLFALVGGNAQEAPELWDLQKCLDYARENNLFIQQTAISSEIAEVNLRENRFSRLPNLNFDTRVGTNFGRTIDPTTNTFDNQSITYNTFSLSAGMPVFSGNRIVNGIKQSLHQLEASKKTEEATVIDQLNLISNDYLTVLLAQDQLDNQIKAKELTEQQLRQTNKLIDAGVLPENDRLDILAQLALNEQNVLNGENAVKSALLNLKNRLNLPADKEISIVRPELEIPENLDFLAYRFATVYEKAIQASPEVQASRAQVKSSESGVSIAKGALLPTVSIFGNINSNFSDAFKRESGNTIFREFTQPVIIAGEELDVTFINAIPEFEDVPYVDQMRQNFGQSVGLALSMPLFNRFSTRSAIQRSKLNLENAEIQYQQVLQQYQNLVQTTINDVIAAKANYESAQKSLVARKTAFENTEKRFNLGAVNTFDYITAKNVLDQAELNFIQAKYTYAYRVALIKFIAGDWKEPVSFF